MQATLRYKPNGGQAPSLEELLKSPEELLRHSEVVIVESGDRFQESTGGGLMVLGGV